VPTEHGEFVDLLALDRTGGIVIIELKKDKSPREIVAQVLDYGIVVSEKMIASQFQTTTGPLFDQPLDQPGLKKNASDPLLAEHVVGIDWQKTIEPHEAKWFKGAFANQNIVCKLRDQATVDFLMNEFGLKEPAK
jgi:hypothetical protein